MSHGRVLFLTYELDVPSFRYRMRCLFGDLAERGWTIREEEFPRGRYFLRTWERRQQLAWADVVVISKINLNRPEAALLRRYGRRVVFDFDDAIYVRKPRTYTDVPDESPWRRGKFLATCRIADVIVAGNETLASAARPSGKRIVVLPTPVNVHAYDRPGRARDDQFIVVWIGRPENLMYLELARPALARLAQRYPALRLRIVCSEFPDWKEIEIERVRWSPDSEIEALTSAHVGIMPLTDNAWTRGKCAFKLLQYMAASLPCVASPVGANCQAVRDGITGFLADSDAGWEQALERLMESPALRARLGVAGRESAAERYSVGVHSKRYADLLSEVLSDGLPASTVAGRSVG
ncbi:MAG TPA: glycosyltransferase family 4 protein [Steroidobacteraceae bacterium]|nr:glycosyltransferase family 4 protein [Steroidobacteraceae bacterium]